MALSPADVALLLRLVLATLLVETLVPLGPWRPEASRTKQRPALWLLLHCAIAGVAIYVAAGAWLMPWPALVAFAAHLGLDGGLKRWTDPPRPLLVRALHAAAHALAVALLWLWLTEGRPWSAAASASLAWIGDPRPWLVASAYAVVLWPVGAVVGEFTKRWHDEIERRMRGSVGLPGAGLWIGCIERFLILSFVLLGHYEAIGFLIAAKSLLRFPGIAAQSGRGQAKPEQTASVEMLQSEYVLVGTLMSFAAAILIGVVTVRLLALMP